MRKCTLCKVAEIPGGSWCKPCRQAYLKKYRADNPDKIRDLNQAWREKNRDGQRVYKDNYFHSVTGRCVELYRQAKRRADRRGHSFSLTTKWVLAQWKEQNGCCAITGLPLQLKQESSAGDHNYTGPSLDRRDPEKGYDPDNVRLVCYGINCCLHDFGEPLFKLLAENVVHGLTQQPTKYPSPATEALTDKQRQDIVYRSSFEGTVTALHHGATKNAREKGFTCTLTKEFVRSLLASADRCLVTGFEFDLQVGHGRANPLRPSLDRIDSSVGYLPENVRLVCVAANYGLNEFGEEAFRKLCAAYLEHNR